MKKGKPWLENDIKLLFELYPNTPNTVLAKILNRTAGAIRAKAHKIGTRKTDEYLANNSRKNTQFEKGHTPWNKGIPGSAGFHPNSRRTQFKKGEMSGAAQHNYVPIGSTRITRDGALERKVTDDPKLYPARRWVPVTRLVWEAAYGPIPDKHVVRFKPGMQTAVESEITLDKLECISLAENMRRNTLHRYPKEIAHLIQLKGAINRQINKRNQRK